MTCRRIRTSGQRIIGRMRRGRGIAAVWPVLCALSATVTCAADTAALTEKCATCHGPQGYSEQPDVPVIAGFSRQGFIDTLAAFRDGDRVAIEYHPPGSAARMMNDIARELTDAEVEVLADYYSRLPFVARHQPFDDALASRGAVVHDKLCERCHSNGGSEPEDDAAILAGQWTPYLRRQFADIADGKRRVPRAMLKRFQQLDDSDKEALLHFYASLR